MAHVQPLERNEVQGKGASCETRTTSSGQGGGVARIVVAWRALCESFAPPLGYEDETGFHYGDAPKSADEA